MLGIISVKFWFDSKNLVVKKLAFGFNANGSVSTVSHGYIELINCLILSLGIRVDISKITL